MSNPLSSAILRASGEIKILSRDALLGELSSLSEDCCDVSLTSCVSFSCSLSSFTFSDAKSSSSLSIASPSSPIIPNTALTSASSPACTLISNNVPLAGASTSLVNFSELIVTILSPCFTVSPSDLNHSSTVPSFIVIPSFGIIIFSLIVIHLLCVSLF